MPKNVKTKQQQFSDAVLHEFKEIKLIARENYVIPYFYFVTHQRYIFGHVSTMLDQFGIGTGTVTGETSLN